MPQRGQRRELLGARRAAAGGHLRALVPGEQARGSAEVRDLVQRRQQLVECRGDRATYAGEAMARSAPSAAAATASRRTGIPFRCAMPASRSRSSGSEDASRLTFAPPAALATLPAAAVAPAVRQRDRARLHLVGDRHRRSRSTPCARADPAALAVVEPERLGVVGMDRGPRACARRASAAARCASRSCASAARAGRSAAAGSRGRGRCAPPAARASSSDLRRVEAHPLVAVADLLARARRSRGARRARSRAGVARSFVEVEPAAAQAEQVALGAGAQQQVDQPPRREPHAEPCRAAAAPQTLEGDDADPPRDARR